MTDEEAQKYYEKLEERFGDDLPDYRHCPIQFQYFVDMYCLEQILPKYRNGAMSNT